MGNTDYNNLRDLYPKFTYQKYEYCFKNNHLIIQFHFSIGDTIHFTPKIELAAGNYFVKYDKAEIEGIIFHIGMIELISYWKCTCSPILHIAGHSLDQEQQKWWKKLYFKGLGEFFYHNRITAAIDSFLNFEFDEPISHISDFSYQKVEDSNRIIVPIGGGKDSVVTLEQLRDNHQIVPFIINPRGATLDCARIAGFGNTDDLVILKREISPRLLELNASGFLNGHTPFSAMLAFYSILVSYITQTRLVALSNESSANEPTIPGTEINHQYSKSMEFEEDFRYYVNHFMGDINHYYSHLRQYSELQIAEQFARHPQYFPVFKSCNAGSKENKWCCNCSKCLFAYIILSPFIDDATMISIFGEDLLNKPSMQQYFDELTGRAANKPFECVGTIDEVNEAIRMIKKNRNNKYLLKN